ncbi:PiggyBac transposable element-derived protein 4, partial [Cucumispora dikerogammari]
NRKLFMDNYYNSFDLAEKLYNSGIYSCGTLRSRRGGPENLNSIKKTVTREKNLHFKKSRVEVMIWCDKRPVAMLINCFDTREMVSKNNKQIPKCIDEYNTYMGGVDKFDQMIKYYFS